MRQRLIAVLVASAVAASSAVAATAATGPGNQQSGIVKAVQTLLGKDKNKATVEDVKITTVPDKVWAIAQIEAKPAYEDTFQSFYAILLKVPDIESSFRWVVADFGTAFVGCGVAPIPVMRDLTGTKNPCPPAAFG